MYYTEHIKFVVAHHKVKGAVMVSVKREKNEMRERGDGTDGVEVRQWKMQRTEQIRIFINFSPKWIWVHNNVVSQYTRMVCVCAFFCSRAINVLFAPLYFSATACRYLHSMTFKVNVLIRLQNRNRIKMCTV